MTYPKPWLAAALNLLLQPLGMLYAGRAGLAILYFLGFGILAGIDFFAPSTLSLVIGVVQIVVLLVSVAHAYHLAKNVPKDKQRPTYSTWRGMLGVVAVFFAIVFVFRSFFVEPYKTPSGSMLPTFKIGGHLIVQKWGYGHYGSYGINVSHQAVSASLLRGDVIVFDYPMNPSLTYIKRIVGLPGDLVVVKGQDLFINGQAVPKQKIGDYPLRETSLADLYTEQLGDTPHTILLEKKAPPLFVEAIAKFPSQDKCSYSKEEVRCEVPANNYFVMGDNRDNSQDSRHWGFVPSENVVGKVIYVTP